MTTPIPVVEEWEPEHGLPEWLRVPLQLAREAWLNDADSQFSGSFDHIAPVDLYMFNTGSGNEEFNAVDINFFVSPCDDMQRWNVTVCPALFNHEELYVELTESDFSLYEGELQDVYWKPV